MYIVQPRELELPTHTHTYIQAYTHTYIQANVTQYRIIQFSFWWKFRWCVIGCKSVDNKRKIIRKKRKLFKSRSVNGGEEENKKYSFVKVNNKWIHISETNSKYNWIYFNVLEVCRLLILIELVPPLFQVTALKYHFSYEMYVHILNILTYLVSIWA